MQYTDYLAAVIQAHGRPSLTDQGFKDMMNIVHLEGRCAHLKELEAGFKDESFVGKLRFQREQLEQKIQRITGRKTPQKFIIACCGL